MHFKITDNRIRDAAEKIYDLYQNKRSDIKYPYLLDALAKSLTDTDWDSIQSQNTFTQIETNDNFMSELYDSNHFNSYDIEFSFTKDKLMESGFAVSKFNSESMMFEENENFLVNPHHTELKSMGLLYDLTTRFIEANTVFYIKIMREEEGQYNRYRCYTKKLISWMKMFFNFFSSMHQVNSYTNMCSILGTKGVVPKRLSEDYLQLKREEKTSLSHLLNNRTLAFIDKYDMFVSILNIMHKGEKQARMYRASHKDEYCTVLGVEDDLYYLNIPFSDAISFIDSIAYRIGEGRGYFLHDIQSSTHIIFISKQENTTHSEFGPQKYLLKII